MAAAAAQVNFFLFISNSLHFFFQLRTTTQNIEDLEIEHLLALPNVRELNLNCNALRVVPPRLGLMTQLRALQLHGNPQRGVNSAKLGKPLPDLLAYLRLKMPAAQ